MTWKIDSAHTRVAFSIRHMLISNVHGQFRKLDGTLDIDEAQPTRSSVDLQIEAASIDTRCEMRDAHLRSADYFDTKRYPYLTFKSKRLEVVDDRHGTIQGDLTIKGLTHAVVLDVAYGGLTQSPWGAMSARYTATAAINRNDYDFNMNPALVGDTINISIELEIVKQGASQPVLAAN